MLQYQDDYTLIILKLVVHIDLPIVLPVAPMTRSLSQQKNSTIIPIMPFTMMCESHQSISSYLVLAWKVSYEIG
jgi:hypothetical protein